MEDYFKFKKPNFKKLIDYGFVKTDKDYVFNVDILEDEFNLKIAISLKGEVSFKLFDNKTKEEYVLIHIKDSVGEFVGTLRTEIDKILKEISEKCFENEIFKTKQAKFLINYIKDTWNEDLEFLWKNFPTDAIWRRHDNKKWYALILTLSKRKLGVNNDKICEIIVFRINPAEKEKIVDNKKIFEGYHMNKKSWATLCLDENVSNDELLTLINSSRQLALKK